MLDHDDARSRIADRAQEDRQFRGLAVVQAGRRLIEQQQSRVGHQRAHHLDQLLRADRQIGGGDVARLSQPDHIEKRVGLVDQMLFSSRRAARVQSICEITGARTCRCAPAMTFSSVVMPGKTRAV